MRDVNPDTEVIVLTSEGTIENAVESMRRGVFDFLSKPFSMPELERRCLAANDRRKLRKENSQLREVIDRTKRPATTMIGESDTIKKVFPGFQQCRLAACTTAGFKISPAMHLYLRQPENDRDMNSSTNLRGVQPSSPRWDCHARSSRSAQFIFVANPMVIRFGLPEPA